MSTPNPVNLNNLDARYAKPADVAAAISAQAVTDAGQFTQKWKANTIYVSGQLIIAPDGSIVAANAGFTSSNTYNAANWTVLTATASSVSNKVPLGARAAGQWLERPNPFQVTMGPGRSVRRRTPSISYGSLYGSPTISGAVQIPISDPRIRRLGAGNNPYVSFQSSTTTYYQAPGTGTNSISTWEFETDAQQIEILMYANPFWNILVDNEYAFPAVRNAGTDAGMVNGNRYWVKIDFGSREPKGRMITIFGSGLPVSAIAINAKDTVRWPRIPVGPRLAIMTHSYGQRTSKQCNAGPWWPLADKLGIRDVVVSSVGGTGYLNANSSYTTFRQRLSDITNAGSDIVLTSDPLNDQSRQTKAALLTETTAYFGALRNALPNAVLIASGIFTPNGSNATNTNYIDARDAVKQGIATVTGPWLFIDTITGAWNHSDGRTGTTGSQWITGTGNTGNLMNDGNADYYISSDGTHPADPDGDEYLASQFAAAIVDGLNIGVQS